MAGSGIFEIFVHPPWSQGVNFDAPITFSFVCLFYAKRPINQKKKTRAHMQFPKKKTRVLGVLELFTKTFLIGFINRRDVTSLYKNLVKIKKTNFLRAAIQEPKFCVDRKQATSVAMGKVLASAQKISPLVQSSHMSGCGGNTQIYEWIYFTHVVPALKKMLYLGLT